LELAKFLNQKYRDLTGCDISQKTYVRSERMLLNDLKSWGYEWTNNKLRPYFLGHEREDVVKHREGFVKYLVERKETNYYTVSDKGEWIMPNEKPCVLLFHDETINRPGEQLSKRWMLKNKFERRDSFFNKD
jgi:hypothetical protein